MYHWHTVIDFNESSTLDSSDDDDDFAGVNHRQLLPAALTRACASRYPWHFTNARLVKRTSSNTRGSTENNQLTSNRGSTENNQLTSDRGSTENNQLNSNRGSTVAEVPENNESQTELSDLIFKKMTDPLRPGDSLTLTDDFQRLSSSNQPAELSDRRTVAFKEAEPSDSGGDSNDQRSSAAELAPPSEDDAEPSDEYVEDSEDERYSANSDNLNLGTKNNTSREPLNSKEMPEAEPNDGPPDFIFDSRNFQFRKSGKMSKFANNNNNTVVSLTRPELDSEEISLSTFWKKGGTLSEDSPYDYPLLEDERNLRFKENRLPSLSPKNSKSSSTKSTVNHQNQNHINLEDYHYASYSPSEAQRRAPPLWKSCLQERTDLGPSSRSSGATLTFYPDTNSSKLNGFQKFAAKCFQKC